MDKRWVLAAALVATLVVPAIAVAHEGHPHKVLGTVESVQGNHVQVKGTDGKVITIMLDSKTAITRGKGKVDAAALKTGDRVSVE